MRRLCLIGAAFMALSSGAAFADTAIGGWTVTDKPDENGVCMASHIYNDKDDDNKRNSVVFGLAKGKTGTQLIVVLGYEDWNFDKGEAVVGDFLVDGKAVYKKWKWEGDGKVLTAVFADSDALVPVLGAGKKIFLHFGKDGEANFQIPNAGMALGAAQHCMG